MPPDRVAFRKGESDVRLVVLAANEVLVSIVTAIVVAILGAIGYVLRHRMEKKPEMLELEILEKKVSIVAK